MTGPAGPALILHATSDDRPNDLVLMTTAVPVDGRQFEMTLRLIARPPALLDFQREMTAQAAAAEADALIGCGVWR